MKKFNEISNLLLSKQFKCKPVVNKKFQVLRLLKHQSFDYYESLLSRKRLNACTMLLVFSSSKNSCSFSIDVVSNNVLHFPISGSSQATFLDLTCKFFCKALKA